MKVYLGVLLAKDDLKEAIHWCQRASKLSPNLPKYAYTLAFYLDQNGEVNKAIKILRQKIGQRSAYSPYYMLLGDIYEKQGKSKEALNVYRQALTIDNLTESEQLLFSERMRVVSSQ
jgi:tetratricopeptide (TPR) repeat protein